MKRILFNLTTVVSLVICAVTVLLWVSSYSQSILLESDTYRDEPYSSGRSIEVSRGGMKYVAYLWFDLSIPGGTELIPRNKWLVWRLGKAWTLKTQPKDIYPHVADIGNMNFYENSANWNFCRFGLEAEHKLVLATRDNWYQKKGDLLERETGVVVPLPAIVALTALLPLLSLRRLWNYRSNRRAAAGKCRACGYDLRATPKRCPECGAVALK